MMKLSMICFKIVRKIALPIEKWYQTNNFLAGVKEAGMNINVWGGGKSLV